MASSVDLHFAHYLFQNVIKNGDCMECHYKPSSKGYCFLPGRESAHRFIYATIKGEIPDNKIVMHTCDNRRCINPIHLRLGTYQENTQDMMAKGRHKRSNKPRLFTEEQRQEMLKMSAEGMTMTDIGKHFGVVRTTIRDYIKEGYRYGK